MFAIAAIVAAVCLFAVAFAASHSGVVILLATALFFIRWCGMYWSLPSLFGAQVVAGALAGAMNFCGNIVGIVVPIVIGLIVETTGSYFLALLFFAAAAAGLLFFSVIMNYERRILA